MERLRDTTKMRRLPPVPIWLSACATSAAAPAPAAGGGCRRPSGSVGARHCRLRQGARAQEAGDPARRPFRRLGVSDLGDRGHDLRPDADAADCVVHSLLVVRHRQGRDLRLSACRKRLRSALSRPRGRCCTGCARCWCARAVTCWPGRWRWMRPASAARSLGAGGKKVLPGLAGEVKEPKGIGWCRMALLADGSSASLHPFVTSHVEPGSTVITDAWMGYHGLAGLGYPHQRRSQRAARARGDDPGELLPAVHRVASLARRWLLSTHQGSVDEAHLQSYLDEFVFRFNRRRSQSRGLVFYRVLELAVGHHPVRYRNIIAGKRPRKTPPPPPTTRGHPPSLERPPAERPWRAAYLDYSG